MRLVKKELKKYFQKEYKCGVKFDAEGTRPNEKRLGKCLAKNETKKEKKIGECVAQDDDPTPEESESTVDPAPEESDTPDPAPVESDTPEEDGCPGVPVAIPTSCSSAYTCDAILEIFEYTEVRVHEHNERRRLHRDTPDVTSNLDIAC